MEDYNKEDFYEVDDLDYFNDENNEKILSSLDNDFLDSFGRIRVAPKSVTDKPKKKKPEVTFKMGEKVLYRNKAAEVVFGPYDKNYKKMYEIQTSDGKVYSASSQALHKYVSTT